MSDFGSLLRKTRQEKTLSFEEIESTIKINFKYLKALEDENISLLPGKAYAIGFLKAYAKFLGLDYRPLLVDLKSLYQDETEIEPQIATVSHININLNKKNNNNNKAIVFFTVVVISIGIYYYLPPKEIPPIKKDILQQKPIETKSSTMTPKPTAPPPIKSNENIKPVVPTIKLSIIGGKSWVMLTVDGKLAFKGILYAGQTKIYSGKKITIKIGNAGVVDITYNNEHLGYIGKVNQVLQKSFGE